MIIRELQPGTWEVISENHRDSAFLRYLFDVIVRADGVRDTSQHVMKPRLLAPPGDSSSGESSP